MRYKDSANFENSATMAMAILRKSISPSQVLDTVATGYFHAGRLNQRLISECILVNLRKSSVLCKKHRRHRRPLADARCKSMYTIATNWKCIISESHEPNPMNYEGASSFHLERCHAWQDILDNSSLGWIRSELFWRLALSRLSLPPFHDLQNLRCTVRIALSLLEPSLPFAFTSTLRILI